MQYRMHIVHSMKFEAIRFFKTCDFLQTPTTYQIPLEVGRCFINFLKLLIDNFVFVGIS